MTHDITRHAESPIDLHALGAHILCTWYTGRTAQDSSPYSIVGKGRGAIKRAEDGQKRRRVGRVEEEEKKGFSGCGGEKCRIG